MNLNRWMVAGMMALGVSAVRAEPVCEVVAVKGQAMSAARAIAVGDKLDVGAELKTGANGRVRLRFIDGSTVVVADNTQLKIAKFELANGKPRDAGLLLETGLIGQKVTPAAGGAWEVRTPTAVTAVRGTEFIVEVGKDSATEVSVQSGQVAVEAVQSAAGGGTRSLKPRSIVLLEDAMAGTQCNPSAGCSKSAPWSAERTKRSQDRLAF